MCHARIAKSPTLLCYMCCFGVWFRLIFTVPLICAQTPKTNIFSNDFIVNASFNWKSKLFWASPISKQYIQNRILKAFRESKLPPYFTNHLFPFSKVNPRSTAPLLCVLILPLPWCGFKYVLAETVGDNRYCAGYFFCNEQLRGVAVFLGI